MNDNKLIAEFMGHKLGLDGDGMGEPQSRIFEKGLGTKKIEDTYSKSWDWLMPVVEKCFVKQEEVSDDLSFKLNDALLETNIESLYRVVVEFIKEHNSFFEESEYTCDNETCRKYYSGAYNDGLCGSCSDDDE